LSGVSLRTIKAIEKGSANPTLELLLRILDPLGLSIDITERVHNEKKGQVFYNNILAGMLEYRNNEYFFTYDTAYVIDRSRPPLSNSRKKVANTS
jgi:transcriptional regulator with XRE-family HTH domain